MKIKHIIIALTLANVIAIYIVEHFKKQKS